MKKKIIGILTVLTMSLMMATGVAAASNAEVTLTSSGEIAYTGNAGQSATGFYLGDAFAGMAPGESRTQTIALKNQNANTVSFFIKEDVLTTMEELSEASGGAYTMTVKVGTDEASATVLMDAAAGGYNSNAVASDLGLAEITELEDYQFVAQLAQGESVNLYITVAINGEGFDSTAANDYSNQTAQMAFNFRAYYEDEEQATVVTKVVDQVTAANTGVETSHAPMIFAVILVILGVAVIGFGIVRSRKAV